MTTHVALAGYGLTLLIVTWVEGAIAIILLLARIYTTWKITRHLRSDLYLALLTFVWPHRLHHPPPLLKICRLLAFKPKFADF
jgi:hypothetical protein